MSNYLGSWSVILLVIFFIFPTMNKPTILIFFNYFQLTSTTPRWCFDMFCRSVGSWRRRGSLLVWSILTSEMADFFQCWWFSNVQRIAKTMAHDTKLNSRRLSHFLSFVQFWASHGKQLLPIWYCLRYFGRNCLQKPEGVKILGKQTVQFWLRDEAYREWEKHYLRRLAMRVARRCPCFSGLVEGKTRSKPWTFIAWYFISLPSCFGGFCKNSYKFPIQKRGCLPWLCGTSQFWLGEIVCCSSYSLAETIFELWP